MRTTELHVEVNQVNFGSSLPPLHITQSPTILRPEVAKKSFFSTNLSFCLTFSRKHQWTLTVRGFANMSAGRTTSSPFSQKMKVTFISHQFCPSIPNLYYWRCICIWLPLLYQSHKLIAWLWHLISQRKLSPMQLLLDRYGIKCQYIQYKIVSQHQPNRTTSLIQARKRTLEEQMITSHQGDNATR